MSELLTVKELKKEFEQLGISQSKIAKAIHCDKDYLNRVINGRIECSLTMSIKLNTYLELIK